MAGLDGFNPFNAVILRLAVSVAYAIGSILESTMAKFNFGRSARLDTRLSRESR